MHRLWTFLPHVYWETKTFLSLTSDCSLLTYRSQTAREKGTGGLSWLLWVQWGNGGCGFLWCSCGQKSAVCSGRAVEEAGQVVKWGVQRDGGRGGSQLFTATLPGTIPSLMTLVIFIALFSSFSQVPKKRDLKIGLTPQSLQFSCILIRIAKEALKLCILYTCSLHSLLLNFQSLGFTEGLTHRMVPLFDWFLTHRRALHYQLSLRIP